MKTTALGHHFLFELHGCPQEVINSEERIRATLKKVALLSKSTVISEAFHRFSPHGITGILLIAESHLSIHTWPEYGYAAADLFSCRKDLEPEEIKAALAQGLQSARASGQLIQRGYCLPLTPEKPVAAPLEVGSP